jgi:hypothetical protein
MLSNSYLHPNTVPNRLLGTFTLGALKDWRSDKDQGSSDSSLSGAKYLLESAGRRKSRGRSEQHLRPQ